MISGLTFNRQSIFDSLSKNLIQTGDVEELPPDPKTGVFQLVDSFYVATAIISSSTTLSIPVITNETMETPIINLTKPSLDTPIIDNIYHQEPITDTKVPTQRSFEWFYQQVAHFGIRGLLIGSIVSICLLLTLLCLIIHLHCKNRQSKKKIACQFTQTNGKKSYSHMKSSSPKKRLPKFLQYFHPNQAKPSSFRLASNGSIARLNSSDSYHLISSIQENRKDKTNSSYQNTDDLFNEHCCTRTNLSPSIYHQVNRLMTDDGEPSVPLSNLSQAHVPLVPVTANLRSMKKDLDNSSVQTYSAVYSCELAANLDIDQEFLPQHQSSIKRRSILRSKNSSNSSQILYLYTKNLIDCYAIQPNHHRSMLLATADENRIQLFHIRVSLIVFAYFYRYPMCFSPVVIILNFLFHRLALVIEYYFPSMGFFSLDFSMKLHLMSIHMQLKSGRQMIIQFERIYIQLNVQLHNHLNMQLFSIWQENKNMVEVFLLVYSILIRVVLHEN